MTGKKTTPKVQKPQPYKLTPEQRQTIGELVGEATMQWSPTPEGAFKSEEANAILAKIFAVVENA